MKKNNLTKFISLVIIIFLVVMLFNVSRSTLNKSKNFNNEKIEAYTENTDIKLSDVQYNRQTGIVEEIGSSSGEPEPGKDNSPKDNYVRALDNVIYELEMGISSNSGSPINQGTIYIKGKLPNQSDLEHKIIQWEDQTDLLDITYNEDKTEFEAYYEVTSDLANTSKSVSFNAIITGWVEEGIVDVSNYTPEFEISVLGNESSKQTIKDSFPLFSSAKDVVDIGIVNAGTQRVSDSENGAYMALAITTKIVGEDKVKGRVYPRGTISLEAEMDYSSLENIENVLALANNVQISSFAITGDSLTDKKITDKSIDSNLSRSTFLNAKGGEYIVNGQRKSVYNAGNMDVAIEGNKLKIDFKNYDFDGNFPIVTSGDTGISENYGYFTAGKLELFIPFYEQTADYYFNIKATKLSYDNKEKILTIDDTNQDEIATNNIITSKLPIDVKDTRTIGQHMNISSKAHQESADYEYTSYWDGSYKTNIGNTFSIKGIVDENTGIYKGNTESLYIWNNNDIEYNKDEIKVEGYLEYKKDNNTTYNIQYGVFTENPENGITKYEEQLNVVTKDNFTWYDSVQDVPEGNQISSICIVSNSNNPESINRYEIRSKINFSIKSNIDNAGKTTYILMRTNIDKDDNGKKTWIGGYDKETKPAQYNSQGVFTGAQSGGGSYLQTIYMQIATLDLEISVEDLDEQGEQKKIYDLEKDKEINYSIKPIITDTQDTEFKNVKVELVLPKELTYKLGSSNIVPEEIINNQDGTTTITYLYETFIKDNVTPIKLTAKIDPFLDNARTVTLNSSIYMPNAVSTSKKHTITIKNDTSFQSDREIENTILAPGESSNITISVKNNTNAEISNVRIIEELPQNGINGSIISSQYKVAIGEIKTEQHVYVSNKSTEELIALGELSYNQEIFLDSTNANFKDTSIWTEVTSNQDITGTKTLIVVMDKMDSSSSEGITYQITVNENNIGDTFSYQAYASKDAESGQVVLKTAKEEQYVLNKNIRGKVWLDSNKDGIINNSEKGIENIEVILVSVASGSSEKETTNENGEYEFSGITDGEYYVKIENLDSKYEVTEKEVGTDVNINSKMNPETKMTDIIQYNANNAEAVLHASYVNIGLKVNAESTIVIQPNGGTWEGKTEEQTFTGSYNKTKEIADPLPPEGYTIKFDTTVESIKVQDKESTKTFTGWIKSNPFYGEFNKKIYTYGAEDGVTSTLTANYTNNSITLPEVEREGYTFVGWYDNNLKVGNAGEEYTPTQDKTLIAKWEAKGDIPYTVKHHKMNVDGNGYTLVETENKTGKADEKVTPEVKQYKGFTSPQTQEIQITADGKAEVNYYYTRNKYQVIVNKEEGIKNTTGAGEYYYEQQVTINAEVSEGYTWKGWTGDKENTNKENTFTMPAGNVEVTATASKNESTLIINPNGGTWEGKTEEQTFTGSYNKTKEIADPLPPEGYTIKFDTTVESIKVQDKESTKTFTGWIKSNPFYGEFNKKIYTYGAEDGVTSTLTANYTNNSITLPEVEREGYTFVGWYDNNLKVGNAGEEYTPTQDKTLIAKWEAKGDIPYTVKHHKMNVDGNGYTLVETENKTGKADEKVTPEVKQYKGFTSPQTQEIQITADGKAEVNYYYTRNKYQVIVNKEEGIKNTTGAGEYYYEQQVTINAEVSEGYTWKGWTGDKENTNKENTFTMPAGNVEVTATASKNESTLIINPNGGVWNGKAEEQSFTQGYNSTLNIENPIEPKGYTVSFDTQIENIKISNMYSEKIFTNWTKSDPFYGILEEKVYTYGAQNGVTSILTANYENGNIILPNVERKGYTFEGWYENDTKIGNAGEEFTPTKDTKLIAKYAPVEVKVISRYFDKVTKEEISDKTEYIGKFSEEYNIAPKDIEYYKISQIPENSKGILDLTENLDGTYSNEIFVNFYYDKLSFNIKVEEMISEISVNGKNKKINNGKLEKLEIHRKNVSNTTVDIRYKIIVTNDSEISGSAILGINIPSNLKFNQDSNKNWVLENNVAKLETEEINPGESKEYEIVLQWVGNGENIGTFENIVKILNTNNKPNYEELNYEDNQDKVEFIITISTGLNKQYYTIILVSVVILMAVVYRIVKIKRKN